MNPLTGVYGAATAFRNTLYDHNLLASRRLGKPVVSVGNISVGGTGKTPFVIALGELLQARGIRFDVLSRGYRRKTRGVLVVEQDGEACDFGDEPLLIARRLNVPVVVGESRYDAGRLAEKQFDSQLHILDDGFQHRELARDLDIVLLTGSEFNDRLVPSGRLREPLSALGRADVVVVPADMVIDQAALRGKVVWRMRREIAVAEAPKSPIVFCGIARPQQFFAQVRALGVSTAAEIAFRDHYAYRRSDLERLVAQGKKLGADGFLTTEKDAINLGSLRSEIAPLAIAVLKLSLDNPASVVDTVLQRVSKEKVGP